ncbi:MAG: glycosyltransferase [Cyanobacteria bacterium]|nr:glycosyltransferase [Cyanobacteriota bacterium]
MRILLVHQNFPGQFRHLARALVEAGHDVVAIGCRDEQPALAGLRYCRIAADADGELRRPGIEARCQAQLAQGRRVAEQLQGLAAGGWRPDVVAGHPFWGDLLFLDDVYAEVPLLALMELDLARLPAPRGQAPGAEPGLMQWTTLQAAHRMAAGISATTFQRGSFPPWLQPRIAVIHEGVDLQLCIPHSAGPLELPNGVRLLAGQPLISFASRNLEPLRGFATLLWALPAVLAQHPGVQVVIVGDEADGYGRPAPTGSTWKRELLAQLGERLDRRRVHFTGLLPYKHLLQLFQMSWAHVYLTEPYVLSWSLLEAMACGALVVGSRTAPVQEVIEHGRQGLLVDLHNPEELAATLVEVLERQPALGALRLAARRRVAERFDRRRCVTRQIALLSDLAARRDPFAKGGSYQEAP